MKTEIAGKSRKSPLDDGYVEYYLYNVVAAAFAPGPSAMNRLHLFSALKDEPTSTSEDVFRTAESSAQTMPDSTESTQTWLLIIAGLLSAAMMASLLCPIAGIAHPPLGQNLLPGHRVRRTHSGCRRRRSLDSMVFSKAKPSFGLRFLYQNLAVSWLFLPCIILLYRQRSPWMFRWQHSPP